MAIYTELKIEALSSNHSRCRGKKYYIFWVCAYSVIYLAYEANAQHYIVICGLPRSSMLFHIISQTARFKKKYMQT